MNSGRGGSDAGAAGIGGDSLRSRPLHADRKELTVTRKLLAVVHGLRAFQHHLLGCRAPRWAGCWPDFVWRLVRLADEQPGLVASSCSTRCASGELEDFRFDVKQLPGAHNPSDPLSRVARHGRWSSFRS